MRLTLFTCTLLALPAAAQTPPKKADAEKAVVAYIKDNIGDPDSLKVVKLGPHDLEGKVGFVATKYLLLGLTLFLEKEDLGHLGADALAVSAKLRRLKAKTPLPLARARYRLTNKTGGKDLHDTLFVVYSGQVIPIGKNRFGDDWVGRLAELVRKTKGNF